MLAKNIYNNTNDANEVISTISIFHMVEAWIWALREGWFPISLIIREPKNPVKKHGIPMTTINAHTI
jgi:hypothetical protein